LYFLRQDNNSPLYFKDSPNPASWIEGRVMWLKQGERYTKVVLKTDRQYIGESEAQSCTGNLLTYLPLSARSRKIKLGSRLGTKARLHRIAKNKNPKAFNFSRYWYLKNIYFQSFPQENEWKIKTGTSSFSIFNSAQHLREKLLKILHIYLPTKNEYGVGASLILGEKSDLSSAIKDAFSQTGSMHVLAVSGLHTGLVFLFVNFLLGLLSIKRKWWSWLKAGLLLCSIWTFALLTGASSSVLRSATMFSFIIIGTTLNKSAIIYNILAASAFFLLIIEPKMLFQPGFQLSYLAVLGIVYFQPKIYRAWYIKNKIGDYAWKLTSVSIAAQIVTLPLSLFYFHQFPIYFWLSGLVVIPAAILILPLGFATFFFHPIPVLGMWAGKILYAVIWLLDSIIFQINSLPFGLIHGVWISGIIVLLLYLLIISSVGFIESKKARWIIYGFFLINLILFQNACKSWETLQQSKIIIYHITKASLIDLIDQHDRISLRSESLTHQKENYASTNNNMFLRTKLMDEFLLSDTPIHLTNFHKQANLLQFRNIKMGLCYKSSVFPAQKTKVNYLLITQNAISTIKDLLPHYDFEYLIFDGSNSEWKVKKWQKQAELLGIESFYTKEKGAFIVDLK